MKLQWEHELSSIPLCTAAEACDDDYMTNAVAISDDGSRVVAGTYYQKYPGAERPRVDGTYGIYVYDTATGTRMLVHEYPGDRGIYDVAISGDGAIVAGGGVLTDGQASPYTPARGILRAFDVASGKVLLDSSDFPDRVNNIALSRDGRVLAAVARFSLYLFVRDQSGLFSVPPQEFRLAGYSDAVDMHPSGSWLAAADRTGTVYAFPVAAGVLGAPATCRVEEPTDPDNPASTVEPVKLHRVAVSRTADALVVAGGDYVYLATPASLQAASPGPVARFSAFDAAGHHTCWGVAIADDASFVSAVVNDRNPAGPDSGRLLKLSPSGTALSKDWEVPLPRLPNSTSIDSSGTLIAACDGYPVRVPGTFHLFDNAGSKLGEHGTTKMCWPIAISADGSGVAGGDDANSLFFFRP